MPAAFTATIAAWSGSQSPLRISQTAHDRMKVAPAKKRSAVAARPRSRPRSSAQRSAGLRPAVSQNSVLQPASKSTDGLFNTALQLQRDQIRSLRDHVVSLERRLQAQAEQNQ